MSSHRSKQELINELERLRLDNADLRRQVAAYEENFKDAARVEPTFFDRHQPSRAEQGGDELFRVVFDSLPDPVILFDEDLNILYSNPAAKDILGEDLLGKRFCVKLLKFGCCSSCDFCNLNECIKRQVAQEEEIEILGPENENLYFRWIVNLFSGKENAGCRLLFSLLRDITDKKELYSENVRAAQLASLGELAAGVAHEINNPVNAIVNFAQLLEEEVEEKDYSAELLSLIVKEGQRIASIIQNLLNFARKEREEFSPKDLKRIMEESLNLSQVQMEKEGIWIENEIPDDLPQVMVRGQEIQQVFINILSNARYALNQKFPEQHLEKVVFIKGELLPGGEMVRIEFYDKGIGIPQTEISKICYPFYSQKPKGKGTGLGLSISYKIIQDHQGKIFFDSKEGEYTKVYVELPVCKQDKENTDG